MKLPPANAIDAPVISDLIRSLSHKLTVSPSGDGAEEFFVRIGTEATEERLNASNFTRMVAEHDSKVLGVVAMRDHRHLVHLFVADGSQCKGIGGALWIAARNSALAAGNPGIFTVNSSRGAIGIYEHWGFTCAGPEVIQYGVYFNPMRLVVRENGA